MKFLRRLNTASFFYPYGKKDCDGAVLLVISGRARITWVATSLVKPSAKQSA